MPRLPIRTVTPTAYRAVISALRPPIAALTKQDWSGGEHLPPQGGFIVAANHISEIDPFILAHFLVDNGTPPLFLAKSSLFELPVLGRVLRGLGQVPVYRGTSQAGDALKAAEAAVRGGGCVVIMPEGTLTRDPDLWPMKAKTGVARLALATRAPVIPVGQWGAQELLAPYARLPTFRRVTMRVKAGPAVNLDDLYARPESPARLRELTDRVLDAVTGLVADLRGEPAPAERFDMTRRDRGGDRREAAPPPDGSAPPSEGDG